MTTKARNSLHILLLASLTAAGCAATPVPTYQPATVVPPRPMREFRGVWVATVNNIDWPSQRDLSTAAQKAELLAILDRVAELKLNAIILQVRPACDALYASKIEPWSEYLTGTMGKAPSPYYDPLAFAIEEAHKRGLQLHAWLNPYRARHFTGSGPVASNHVSRTHPDIVRRYGRYLWLDPGEKATQDYSLSVVMDIVNRYDVDGIHFDDYFYPYAEKGIGGKDAPFPDDASWKKYGVSSGLSRNDWRRENVNQFVQRVYKSIKAAKPHVLFGISPFGIWRPGHPPQIKGYDAYDQLYADARKWMQNGWADYFSPQLYWPINQTAQSFPVLLDWWHEQNAKQHHVWPGIFTAGIVEKDWQPQEIVSQVRLTQKQPGSAGQVHYSIKHLQRNQGLANALRTTVYSQPALPPESPWLTSTNPVMPGLKLSSSAPLQISWSPGKAETPFLWLLQYRLEGDWKTQVLPGSIRTWRFGQEEPDLIALRSVNRLGRTSAPTGLVLKP